ncbi:para-aminobenzoate synthase component 1 [Thermacetogenium phaeum DSM 12270]|uniref:aminodeoxychorismate synthase n=1 Tax=Thermacetogenium phaeum (strain ATCC BAA-254 / DSM 26808 / PB) TaxID=1089553 RepID=K4LW69_THEPS|nr:aminodeoxychorismate synthase, component I [Thermacetogenium phaeum]AFV12249.1 para-aminobenzoate synthase component 1 [Thermacetogenium phaeum DSM 12270]
MIIKEVDLKDTLSLFEPFRSRFFPFLLDSGMDPSHLGRYSIMGSDPFLVIRAKGREIAVFDGSSWIRKEDDPFSVLRQLLSRYQLPGSPHLPVVAGAFGYCSYDLGRLLEKLPEHSADDLKVPDLYLGFYDRLAIIDHLEGRAFLTSTGLPEVGEARLKVAERRLRELQEIIANSRAPVDPVKSAGFGGSPKIFGHFTRDSYCRAVQKVKDYIAAGDIFQANLTQRFSCPLEIHPWHLYLRLRLENPAPFAAYLHYPELDVVSASPERFLRVRGRLVETRPIKGTRPRGRNQEEDMRLREELLHSEKDRAELTMIIDLERNDLGKVCSYGSVHVPELICLEEYATVFHLVSTVRGVLAPGRDLVDLLCATFPGGSITGAPKIRAMEIIDELEPVRRGIYTGSIGYLGFDGNADLNIVIRTFIVKDGVAYFNVGGGIVADSDPEAEYRETITKARALLRALGYRREEVAVCLE